jgi:hypothetical protein
MPKEQTSPPLGTKPPSGTLRCISCSLDPVFVDKKAQGRVSVHITLQVASDGTVETATVDKSPSDSLAKTIQDQMVAWLFEPPTKDGHPIRVKNESDITVNVIRPR